MRLMHRTFLSLLVVLTFSATGFVPPTEGQTASLVKDVLPGRNSRGGAFPGEMWTLGNKVLFVASEASSGRELWLTDGTGSGTRMLADFFPGEDSSEPRILGTVGALAFGIAVEDASCCGTLSSFLWRSDGTREGTFLLDSSRRTLIPFVEASLEEDPVVTTALADDAVYFTGCRGETGCGVWRTDGTLDGTRLLRQTGGSFNSGYPAELTVARGRLFFARRQELWTSDGTPDGTTLVRDFGSGTARHLAALGSQVLFLAPAAAPATGDEVWVSDGTTAGTRALTGFAVDRPFLQTRFLKTLGDKVYFVADDAEHGAELWASNGTPAGTVRVTDFGFHDPFDADSYGLLSPALGKAGDRLIFWATDGLTGHQLWSSRGEPASTAPVCPSCRFYNENIRFVPLNGKLLFAVEEQGDGRELWTTDGTTAGTKRIVDACPGYCDGVKSDLILLSGTVYFPGPGVDDYEAALWVSDGTPQGTRRFATPVFSSRTVAVLGRKIVFGARKSAESDPELWLSDGTPAGTRQLTAYGYGASAKIRDLVASGDRVFFTAAADYYDDRRHVWGSAGTSADTLEWPEPSPRGFDGSRLATAGGRTFLIWNAYPFGDQLWLVLDDGQTRQLTTFGTNHSIRPAIEYKGRLYFLLDRRELWVSDGTVQGTGRAIDVPNVDALDFLQLVGSELWFLAESSSSFGLSQVWRTNGTQAGTHLVHDFGAYRTKNDPEFTKLGANVYFVASRPHSDDFDYQVWKSDGTGATMITSFPNLNAVRGLPAELTAFQGSLYFMASLPDSPARRGLWRSDGTAAGTMIKELPLGVFDTFRPPRLGLTTIGSHLVFTVDDGVHGSEPWSSDGTPRGTGLLRDIFPGAGGSEPAGFQEAAGQLFFSATDGTYGFELWRTDGTSQGTRLVQDIAPEGASSYPADFTAAGGRLFFSADDGLTGNELWALPLGGPACQPSATALCLNGGRFKVEASWMTPSEATGTGQAVPLSADTGTFWFFEPTNVEAVVKVLDGRSLNDHFWTFYGALSDVEYALTVTDTQTGLARRYVNPQGQLASVGDTQSFGPLGARAAKVPESTGASPCISERIDTSAVTGTCVPGPLRLCLNGGRFAVEAVWKDSSQRTGSGTAVTLTGDTGYFWFFDAANVEVVLKVLDATAVNNHFWVFYGALSNVEYTLTVTDTVTGKVKSYKNPQGQFGSVGDTAAF